MSDNRLHSLRVNVMQWIIRFLLGGTMVCAFALLADVLKPKGFAGLFGAAPSVALGSLALTTYMEGSGSAATQAHSMICGALAFCVYALACTQAMGRWHWRARSTTIGGLVIWAGVALALWAGVLRT
jgi:hypothetical protein